MNVISSGHFTEFPCFENQRNRGKGVNFAASTAIVAGTIVITIVSTYLRIAPPPYHRALCRISSSFSSVRNYSNPLMTQTQHIITHHSLSADATWGDRRWPNGVKRSGRRGSMQGAGCLFGVGKMSPFHAVRWSMKDKRVFSSLVSWNDNSRDICLGPCVVLGPSETCRQNWQAVLCCWDHVALFHPPSRFCRCGCGVLSGLRIEQRFRHWSRFVCQELTRALHMSDRRIVFFVLPMGTISLLANQNATGFVKQKILQQTATSMVTSLKSPVI